MHAPEPNDPESLRLNPDELYPRVGYMTHYADVTLPDLTGGQAGGALKPIDVAYLDRTTFSDKALAQEVLVLFRSSASDYLEGLKCARNAHDWFDAAHSLKGSAKAVGAFRLAEAAAAAEGISGEPFNMEHREALLDLDHHLAEVDDFIKGLLAQN